MICQIEFDQPVFAGDGVPLLTVRRLDQGISVVAQRAFVIGVFEG
jgi:hypothetical protein